MLNFFAHILTEIGRIIIFSITIFRKGFLQSPRWDCVLEEMYKVGIWGLPVLFTISTFVGSNLAVQGAYTFQSLGGQGLVGMFIAVAGVRELAPLIATTVIGAKTGTEMATTLAMMRITEQIDALEIMGVNPYWYLIVPRLLAVALVLPVLILFSIFICFMVGLYVSVWQLHIDAGTFIDNALRYMAMKDILYGILKGGFFGVVVCVMSCYYGFHSEKGPLGVGLSANKAIVGIVIICCILNLILSGILYA